MMQKMVIQSASRFAVGDLLQNLRWDVSNSEAALECAVML